MNINYFLHWIFQVGSCILQLFTHSMAGVRARKSGDAYHIEQKNEKVRLQTSYKATVSNGFLRYIKPISAYTSPGLRLAS